MSCQFLLLAVAVAAESSQQQAPNQVCKLLDLDASRLGNHALGVSLACGVHSFVDTHVVEGESTTIVHACFEILLGFGTISEQLFLKKTAWANRR
jgi:hypothetical protein